MIYGKEGCAMEDLVGKTICGALLCRSLHRIVIFHNAGRSAYVTDGAGGTTEVTNIIGVDRLVGHSVLFASRVEWHPDKRDACYAVKLATAGGDFYVVCRQNPAVAELGYLKRSVDPAHLRADQLRDLSLGDFPD